MIRHIVFFGCKDPESYHTIFAGLKLLESIPDCRYLEIGENLKSDPISQASPDFVVYGEFESEEQLAAFKLHPAYLKSIEIVRPLRDMRIAADFVSSS